MVATIGVNAFAFCSSLGSFRIPSRVTGIGREALYQAPLKTVFADRGRTAEARQMVIDSQNTVYDVAFIAGDIEVVCGSETDEYGNTWYYRIVSAALGVQAATTINPGTLSSDTKVATDTTLTGTMPEGARVKITISDGARGTLQNASVHGEWSHEHMDEMWSALKCLGNAALKGSKGLSPHEGLQGPVPTWAAPPVLCLLSFVSKSHRNCNGSFL